jgi:hypothetical protein
MVIKRKKERKPEDLKIFKGARELEETVIRFRHG